MAILRSATLVAGGGGYRARGMAGGAGRCLPHPDASQARGMVPCSVCPSFLSFPEFYDISNQKCVRVFTFIDLDSCVMVMNYW